MSRSSRYAIKIVMLIIVACNNNSGDKQLNSATLSSPPLNEIPFNKLVGTWKQDGKNLYEQWTKVDSSHYQSQVYTTNNTDTAWEQKAIIFLTSGNWVFENTVKNQNQGKAVRFTSSTLSSTSVKFSNTSHDFPQHVNYTLMNDSILHAYIAGPNAKGGTDTIRFNYHRYEQ